MRKTRFIIAFTLLSLVINSRVLCQTIDNVIINQEDLDKLIVLALGNSPNLDKLQAQLNSINYQKKLVNSEHLGLVFATGNLNEYSIKEIGGASVANNFYPRYNVGLNVTFDHFGKVKNKKKILTENHKIILNESEITERQIISEVTTMYYEYIVAKNILNVKKKIEQFNLVDFNSIEKEFSEGDIDLAQYSIARKDFYSYKLEIIQAEESYLKARSQLENLINTTLNSLGIE